MRGRQVELSNDNDNGDDNDDDDGVGKVVMQSRSTNVADGW